MKEKIVIVDCNAGNLNSVKNALEFLGKKPVISSCPAELQRADRIVFPGVGSFGYAMKQLRESGLEQTLKTTIKEGKPFLGICLGLQLLFEKSEESKGTKGLGIFKGKVVLFRQGKVPQIGWNKVIPINSAFQENYYYFINSYYAVPKEPEIISAKTNYYNDFASAIQFENITAVQFHPEKSGVAGLDFLERWLNAD
jgi:imidazole glycerol phosphate synthase glutamine amidotransferase subunit